MANIEINGKKIEVELGSMIIEAADTADIWIPRFCYHKKLSIAANCRMCLVEVERSPKPLPACATPVSDGMKIWTRSPKAIQAQKAVMEFLLINHPLDCPICDQGGECELQDLSMGYGKDASQYTLGKRSIKDKDIGPLIATDMTRCIQCTRCVRFGSEIAGLRELGATGRGEHMEIGTFIERSVESEVSGNIIDLCPVGALTSKPYRFKARGFELTQKASLAPHDCVGSNIYIHTRRNEVMRVVPRPNESINEIWLSDRDRFSYEALECDRLTEPKIKEKGVWKTVGWEEALEASAKGLLKHVGGHEDQMHRHGDQMRRHGERMRQGDQMHRQGDRPLQSLIGALASPNSTTEEFYLLQKLLRGLGSNNIDHRLRQLDFREQDKMPTFPHAGLSIAELETKSAIFLIGSDIRAEQPILGLKLRKAAGAGGKIFIINPVDFPLHFDVAQKIIVEGGDLCNRLASIAKALLNRVIPLIAGIQEQGKNPKETSSSHEKQEWLQWLEKVPVTPLANQFAKELLQTSNAAVLVGTLGLHHPDASCLMALAQFISECIGGSFGVLTDGANAAGGWVAGAVPHRLPGGEALINPGLNTLEMCRTPLQSMILVNIEPDLDCANGAVLQQQLKTMPCVIALTPFESASLNEVADILLPICPFSENSGSLINAEGIWQSFQAVVEPLSAARPAWKVLRVLGNLCNIKDFDYVSREEVLFELRTSLKQGFSPEPWSVGIPEDIGTGLQSELQNHNDRNDTLRIALVPSYSSDNLLRRSKPLQMMQGSMATVRLNSALAQKLGILSGGTVRVKVKEAMVKLPVMIDEHVPDRTVIIPMGIPETVALGAPYETVEIQRV